MNNMTAQKRAALPAYQVKQFSALITRLHQCCQERAQIQSELFELPDAELRCLLLFGEERYLTPKGIAQKMDVAKSRVSKIVAQMINRGLIQRTPDPEDSRVVLLSLTAAGQAKWKQVSAFMEDHNTKILSLMDPEERNGLLTYLGILERSLEQAKESLR
jgi:DNA-binding MarR family transcriptional regulator